MIVFAPITTTENGLVAFVLWLNVVPVFAAVGAGFLALSKVSMISLSEIRCVLTKIQCLKTPHYS